jgi:hypothetical protein
MTHYTSCLHSRNREEDDMPVFRRRAFIQIVCPCVTISVTAHLIFRTR